MAWYDKVLPTIQAVAPAIALSLGGPVAAMGVNALFAALGVNSPQEAEEALLTMTPESAARVREADQQFIRDMKKLDIDLEALAVQDRGSARSREIAVKDRTPAYIAAMVTFGFFSQLGLLAFLEIPAANKEAFFILLGALGAGFTMMLQYYYGSSSSAKHKDMIIADTAASAVASATSSRSEVARLMAAP